jgi:hypothetical protein
MDKQKIAFICFLFWGMTANIFAQGEPSKNYLNQLLIENEELTFIVDSILNYEKNCDYYSSDLLYAIHIHGQGGFSTLTIGAVGFKTIEIGNELGYFNHRSHVFIVYGYCLDNTLFSKSGKKKTFNYFKPNNRDNEMIIYNIEDDSFSFWIYKYIQGDFVFQGLHTHCE